MKEHIHTIPVTEAFEQNCECPLCYCQRKLENEALEYELGAAMMEPDHRIETNKSGFCARHYEKLYNLQINRLPYGLVLDTHIAEQNQVIAEMYRKVGNQIQTESMATGLDNVKKKIISKKNAAPFLLKELIEVLDQLEHDCAVCKRVNRTVSQYADTILYMFFREPDFRKLFDTSKGFCLPHFKLLLMIAATTLSAQKQAMVIRSVLPLQIENLERIQEEVHWFTQMFDHKNRGSDWKNSKDAISRTIEKLGGSMNLD